MYDINIREYSIENDDFYSVNECVRMSKEKGINFTGFKWTVKGGETNVKLDDEPIAKREFKVAPAFFKEEALERVKKSQEITEENFMPVSECDKYNLIGIPSDYGYYRSGPKIVIQKKSIANKNPKSYSFLLNAYKKDRSQISEFDEIKSRYKGTASTDVSGYEIDEMDFYPYHVSLCASMYLNLKSDFIYAIKEEDFFKRVKPWEEKPRFVMRVTEFKKRISQGEKLLNNGKAILKDHVSAEDIIKILPKKEDSFDVGAKSMILGYSEEDEKKIKDMSDQKIDEPNKKQEEQNNLDDDLSFLDDVDLTYNVEKKIKESNKVDDSYSGMKKAEGTKQKKDESKEKETTIVGGKGNEVSGGGNLFSQESTNSGVGEDESTKEKEDDTQGETGINKENKNKEMSIIKSLDDVELSSSLENTVLCIDPMIALSKLESKFFDLCFTYIPSISFNNIRRHQLLALMEILPQVVDGDIIIAFDAIVSMSISDTISSNNDLNIKEVFSFMTGSDSGGIGFVLSKKAQDEHPKFFHYSGRDMNSVGDDIPLDTAANIISKYTEVGDIILNAMVSCGSIEKACYDNDRYFTSISWYSESIDKLQKTYNDRKESKSVVSKSGQMGMF